MLTLNSENNLPKTVRTLSPQRTKETLQKDCVQPRSGRVNMCSNIRTAG